MASKIELYREVLEIEPNSKVFFPLARQLAEDGRQDEAVAVLSRGIGFHPDHLEAKFLLIELLSRQGREGEADAVFADVGAMLARYPSVWLLWSRVAADRSRDPSLALLFLAHYFQNESLSWAEVMERGLKSLGQTAAGADVQARATPDSSRFVPGSDVPAHAEKEGGGAPPLRGAQEVMELAELLEAPEEGGEKTKTRSARGREPVVRTRTMAALLAEQGDTAGALDIYNELLGAAAPGPEREELLGCIHALTFPAASAPVPTPGHAAAQTAPEGGQPAADASQSKGAAKLVSLLEALAGRLEVRAGA
jgi:tetratricopeptide (TPR) repeat protein